ncbi:glutathione S-transferase family protein [Polyangium jinanense]|uniref:Glutathione S-transferase family protein n=1 Tax=Polyangium jinanense TaxID=2829994 RepID=A0A9X4AVG3_9BACT|nr:glutathione S-transferase family protein [Polyangium jinanense]MDC3959848.1 glutathione S-transferase family protein [Polyangium jinanense]MDC3986299.1 glutathione S-transferase family protein [Polyangium jinanense]
MKLYSHPLSGNSHKVRLLLSMLRLEHEEIVVDLLNGEHKTPSFLAMNPLGQVPVLVDGDETLRDSQAILVYLARKYGGEAWLPSDAAGLARVVQWLSFAANEVHHGPFLARLHFLLGVQLDLGLAQDRSRAALDVLDAHLAKRAWLEHDRPTIADIAVFPYVGLVREGKVQLDDYRNVIAWVERVRALPGYVPMPGL